MNSVRQHEFFVDVGRHNCTLWQKFVSSENVAFHKFSEFHRAKGPQVLRVPLVSPHLYHGRRKGVGETKTAIFRNVHGRKQPAAWRPQPIGDGREDAVPALRLDGAFVDKFYEFAY